MRSTAAKGAGVMVRALENEGVDSVFGAPGKENLDFLDALPASRLKLVVTRHEQVARAGHPLVTIGSGANGPGSGEQLSAAVRGTHVPFFNTRMVQFANDSSALFPRRRVITPCEVWRPHLQEGHFNDFRKGDLRERLIIAVGRINEYWRNARVAKATDRPGIPVNPATKESGRARQDAIYRRFDFVLITPERAVGCARAGDRFARPDRRARCGHGRVWRGIHRSGRAAPGRPVRGVAVQVRKAPRQPTG